MMIAEMTPLQIAARKHREADMLRSGTYGRMNGHFRGCSVGCFAYELAPDHFRGGAWDGSNLHKIVADAAGYPEWLARLQDALFEGLPAGECEDWHVQIADALAARGREWPIVLHAVHAAILRISYRTAGPAQDAVQTVLDLHERAVRGEDASDDEWIAAESAAESAAWSAAERAAWSAAWNAARSAARSAAWSAAWSAAERAAESAAWNAARSAAESAAWNAARSAAWSAAERAAESAAYQEIRDGVLAAIVSE